jgi:hypothetical protein
LVELNEKVCGLRPIPAIAGKEEEEDLREQLRGALQEKIEKEVDRIVAFSFLDK